MTEPRDSALRRGRYLAWTAAAILLTFVLTGSGSAIPAAPPIPDGFGPAGFAAALPALLLCGFLPGWWLAQRLGLEDRYARLGAAVILSALLTFVLGWLALALGAPLPGSILWALWPLALAPAAARLSRPRTGARLPRPGASALALTAWVLLVVVVYAANPELRYRIDGWFHGAVTGHLRAAGLPLDDPYFAGQRLAYPWAWHVVLAATVQSGARFGISAFDAMAGWSALAALAVGAFLVALARAWARRSGLAASAEDRAGACAIAAAVVGTNPLGAWFSLGRGLAGQDAGPATWARPFEQGASEVLWTTTWEYPHVSLATFVDKFLTPTAFGLGEAAFLAAGAVLLLAPPAGPWWRGAGLALLAATFAWWIHGAIASALVLVTLTSGAVLARAKAERRRAALLCAALVAGGVLALPYLVATRGGGGGGARLAVQPDLLWSLVAVGAVVIGLAIVERRLLPAAPDGRHAWFAAALVLLAVAATVTLVQRNETKLVNLGLLALAVPAGVAWARLPARAALLLFALLVPTHAIAVAGFALDRGQDSPGRRVPPPGLDSAYAWIGAHTGPRDLFLEAQPAGARDPDRDLLVHGPRALVWGGLGYAGNWGYDRADLDRRARAAHELAAGTLGAATVRDLATRAERTGARIYAVRRGDGASRRPLPGGGASWTRVYTGRALALDRLETAPVAAERR
ncbi:MAG: hypothetical protein ABIP29_09445 [Candidatus Eisenbacteria bacterium]